MGGVRRVPVDSWNTTPSDVLVSTVVHQMYPHPGKAGQRYQSIAQGKTNTAAHPRMHTIYGTVQYCYEIELVKKSPFSQNCLLAIDCLNYYWYLQSVVVLHIFENIFVEDWIGYSYKYPAQFISSNKIEV